MKLNFISVGKIKDNNISPLCGEYLSRIRKFLSADQIEVKEPKGISRKDPKKQIEKEGLELIKRIPEGFSFLLDERGKNYSTVEFSEVLSNKMNSSFKNINFVIGGPFGTNADLKRKTNSLLSLSKLTFTHEMSRLILLEQVYRALTLIKGHKYHY